MLKNMYKWTEDFEKNKKEFENTLLKSGKNIITLKNKKEIKSFKIQ